MVLTSIGWNPPFVSEFKYLDARVVCPLSRLSAADPAERIPESELTSACDGYRLQRRKRKIPPTAAADAALGLRKSGATVRTAVLSHSRVLTLCGVCGLSPISAV